ncbi:MAG TPA: hypothetical protein VFY06_07525 [Verrucomicrobiae bacterium]|nr:hypothetical protein [Verrucomicrobiae bacterium]
MKRSGVKIIFVSLLSGLMVFLISGCTTRSNAAAQAHEAFIAGQNAALRQQQLQAAQTPGITVVGPVKNPHVPWVVGLTLVQAVATANYVGPESPKSIDITTAKGLRQTLSPDALSSSQPVVLQPGDIVELH